MQQGRKQIKMETLTCVWEQWQFPDNQQHHSCRDIVHFQWETNEETPKTRMSSPSDHLKNTTTNKNRGWKQTKMETLTCVWEQWQFPDNRQRHSCRDIVRFQWETNKGTSKTRISSLSDHLKNNTTYREIGAGNKLKWRHLLVYENNDNFQLTAVAPQLLWHYPFPDN